MQRIFVTLFVLASAVAAIAVEPAPFFSVSWQPQLPVNGSVCLFTVEVKGSPEKINGRFLGHDLTFSRGSGGAWYALGGIAPETKPGAYDVTLEAVTQDGGTLRVATPVPVHAAQYKSSRLTVPQKYVTPDPETLKRIEAERAIKTAAFGHVTSSPEWSGNFVAPVPMEVSENYGTSRTFNGKLASVHRGTDFRAPSGTAVHASNAGEVVLARELYYEGNCVVIDHGLGFMTMYMHLSKFEVKEGDKVEKGQTVALSGGTGRVTGPHLHMSVRWSGEYLDPMKLLALKLPSQP
ncbi:MAG TPA: M23 family metallopeptidase [Candidatus Angelobacter sp.]|nr:M23 family metallopeptidase [Candidatus Angelobacter sp.]